MRLTYKLFLIVGLVLFAFIFFYIIKAIFKSIKIKNHMYVANVCFYWLCSLILFILIIP
jgi:hypothetical protein